MRPNSKSAGHILLPEHFMESLRIIFELLDPNRTGFISYEQVGYFYSVFLTAPFDHWFSSIFRYYLVKRLKKVNGLLAYLLRH